ncbi:phage adaptor protein [Acinetobacter ursingii]|uniref:phage adaptor protein n=1 Tax=Acinetobacter ursingii TaxID=108980 RepID=UPI00124EF98D|nr:DUF6682 family protein [Acinetobacter ursingii]
MSVTCQFLLDGVSATQLNDVDKTTWSEELLLSALNQALVMLVLIRPDATAKIHTFECVKGTRQNLPVDGVRLLKVVRNIDAAGEIGRSIKLVNISDLDAVSPNWHSRPPVAVVKEYMFDERAPKWFYVYPPANQGVKVEIEYSASPPEITDPSQPLPVDIVFMQPLQEFMIYKLLSGDGGKGVGMQHLDVGLKLIGAKPTIDNYLSPAKETKAG